MPPDFTAVRRRWYLIAVLHLLTVLHLAYYMLALPGKGESLRFRLLAGATVVVALGVWFIAAWITPERVILLRRRAVRWQGPFLAVGLAGLVFFGASLRPEWWYAQTGLTLALTLVVAYGSLWDAAAAITRPWAWWGGGLLLAAVITALRLNALEVFPPLHRVDEPWTLGFSLSYLRTGQLSDWIMFERDTKTLLFYRALGDWLKLVGLSFYNARLFTFGLTFAVMGLTALAARRLYGGQTAILTTAYLFSSSVLMSAARIRHDIGLGVALALSLWLYAEGLQRDRPIWHFLAGIALGSGVFSHFHAAPFGVVMLVGLYVPQILPGQPRPSRPWRDLVLYGCGGLLVGLLAMGIQPIPPDTGQAVAGVQDQSSSLASLVETLGQHGMNLSHVSQIEFLLVGAAAAAAIWRGQRVDRSLVLALAGLYVALALFAPAGGFEYYLVPLAPLYGLLVGRLLTVGTARLDRPLTRGTMVVGALVLAANLGWTLDVPLERLVRGTPRYEMPLAAGWVREHVPAGATVVGEHVYFLWLTDYDYVSPLAPNLMPDHLRAEYDSLAAVWDAIDVTVFILDPGLSTYPLLKPLVETDYFTQRGYREAVRFGSTVIYWRPPDQAANG
jgi:hypothetical protein